MRNIGRLPGCLVVCALALIGGVTLQQVSAETVLRVAMTAGDMPILLGQPDQGFEGYRFVGYNLYDSLILWDLSRADVVAELRPGLATSWAVDPADPHRWIIALRCSYAITTCIETFPQAQHFTAGRMACCVCLY